MSKWTGGLAGCSAVLLGVCALGVGVAGCSSAGLTFGQGLATFATNVFGGFGVEALKRLYGVFVERPGRPIDENHVILRNLRAAQLTALSDVAGRYQHVSRGLTDRHQAAEADKFTGFLRDYLAQEEERAKTLTAADLAEPTEADALSIRGALIGRSPSDFNASLSARHGAGPAIEAFRAPAEAAMLAELRAAVYEDVPDAFQRLLRGSDDGTDGWFALFIRDAAKRLRVNPEFERIWQGEQTAAIRILAERIGAEITALGGAIDDQGKALQRLGTQLDEIAGEARSTQMLLASIDARLDGTRGWLYFNAAFKPDGWKRFHAFNRAIPFHGREDELAALHGFLNHPDAFRWWIVTGPGGAGKTRLALELCLRAHLNGWRVGFLQKPSTAPATTWLPDTPTLIIADYAAEQMETVRSLAIQLAQTVRPEQPVVRLLLLERQVDEVFFKRFLSSYASNAGILSDRQQDGPPLALPDLSEDDVWSLVKPCPWRSDKRGVEMERDQFFGHLDHLDARRRALVAMLLADAAAEKPDQISFTSLDDVLEALVENARDHHWPRVLGAEAIPVGEALPADVLIAAATMAGHLGDADIDQIEARLGKAIPDDLLDNCARAIGSPLYPDSRRLDGIQPDLIGEYFALAMLKPDRRNQSRFQWLPELAWHADEIAMAAFVTRARQNFPNHGFALSKIGITVPGKTESWWLHVLPILAGDPASDFLSRLQAAYDRLIVPAATDSGAASALARLCWFATGLDRSVVPFAVSDAWAQSVLGLPISSRAEAAMREGLVASVFNTLNHAKSEDALARRDALLEDLRSLAAAYPDDEAVRKHLAMGLLNTLSHAKSENALTRRDALLEDLRCLAAAYPDDAAVREQLGMGLFNTLNDAKSANALARRDALLEDLRSLAAAYSDDAAVRKQLAMGLVNTLTQAKSENALTRRDALLEDLRSLAAAYADDGAVRKPLAMGLFNTLNHAKSENALTRRDALLEDLRSLAAAYPDDEAVREQLGMGLFNTLNHAKSENALARRDALLADLRSLAAAYPDDEAVREQLAMGLFNTLIDAKSEDALARRDALLEDLRSLAADYPDDGGVRERLAMGLFNTLIDAKSEDALARRDALLEDLRSLAAAYPDDGAVRKLLAMGLVNTLTQAKSEDALARRDALLEDLRSLAAAYSDDGAVREQLAMGLFNTLNHAKSENALTRRDALLEDLRSLAAAYPDDEAVREQLGMGLFNTLNHAKSENALARRDALLADLRSLAAAYPDDEAVREQLAMGLFNTLIDAKSEDALARRDALLEDLRSLAADYPDDGGVRERLAMGLFNTLIDAKSEDALARRDALLEDLRSLAAAYPDDGAVRKLLAMGLVNTLTQAKSEDALARRDALLEDLRSLAAAYSDDGAVREQLAMGVVNTLNDAKSENALTRPDTLLEDLRSLAAAYPDDGAVREQLVAALFVFGSHLIQEVTDETIAEAMLARLMAEIEALAARYPDDLFLQRVMDLINKDPQSE